MPVTEDDFGKASLRTSRKAKGTFRPSNLIGTSIADVCAEPELRSRVVQPSNLGMGTVHFHEPWESRRLRKPILDAAGFVIDGQRPSSGRAKPEGIRKLDFVPLPQRLPHDCLKKCFNFDDRPTGYEASLERQWEETPGPGMRPSHPVCAMGSVALEHRRAYPEQQNQATGIPHPALSKAPKCGSEWGGWGANGAPGRYPLQQPWCSIEPEHEGGESEYRFCDARTKRFPEMKGHNTLELTRWHLDTQHVDYCASKQHHTNTATPAFLATARGAARLPAAGRSSGLAAGGTAPHTAR